MLNIAPSKQRLVILFCFALIVLGGLKIWLYSRHRPQAVRAARAEARDEVHRRIGALAADEAAKLLGGSGQVVVVTLGTEQWPIRPAKAEVDGFLKSIRRNKGVVVHGFVNIDPSFVMGSVFGFPAAGLSQAMNENPQADLIVSFAGCPRLTAEETAQLPAQRPKILAVEGLGLPGLAEHGLANGLVQMAIVGDRVMTARSPKKANE
jgi:hypothetical protein